MRITALVFFLLSFGVSGAQDRRAQYPGLLRKAYFGLNIGSINYPFSNQHLATGYAASSVHVPHTAVRLTLLGYHFTPNLSARITYMRPVNWVEYRDINGTAQRHSVWMNVGGLTAVGKLPLSKKIALWGEGGLGVITRNGFDIDEVPVVTDASYASVLAGGGLMFSPNRKWDFNVGAVYSPERKNHKQPHTVFVSGGFSYNMQPLSDERVQRNSDSRYKFPKHLLQVGYASNVIGYGVNDFFSEGPVPIFWGGEVVLKNGFSVSYTRNVFHTRKVFSLDIGANAGYWTSRGDHTSFFNISVYPLLRFTVLRTKPLDLYLYHSVAGPTFLSKVFIDGKNTGKQFTFRDYMGMGIYAGRERNVNLELNIGHFSNGNIFPSNAGVKIPLSLNVGWAF